MEGANSRVSNNRAPFQLQVASSVSTEYKLNFKFTSKTSGSNRQEPCGASHGTDKIGPKPLAMRLHQGSASNHRTAEKVNSKSFIN